MSPHPNIALIGAVGAGKDTVANILSERYGYQRHALADSLRRFLEATDVRYAAAVSYYGYEQAKKTDPYVRDRLIEIGIAARDHIHPDIWVYALLDSLPEVPVVVTDVRFANEVEALDDEGFEFIHVDRPGHVYSGVPTELPFVPRGYVLHNDGDLADLEAKVRSTIETISMLDMVSSF
jgi:hypothetical protein